jgi:TonB family protein
MGMAGILEAFSSRAAAFGNEQIDALREMAEVAEAAYEREYRMQAAPSAKPPIRKQLFAALTSKDKEVANEMFGEPSPERRYWILGGALIAVLLVTGVLWLTWHEPLPDTGEKNAQPAKAMQAAAVSQPSIQLAPKPEAGLGRRGSSKNGPLKNAAEIAPDEDIQRSAIVLVPSESRPAKQNARTSSTDANYDAPPTISITSSGSSGVLQGLAAAPATMPALGVRISQGVTQGVLIHQVQPTYPTQARAQRLAGSVDLDATIDQKGLVKSVKIVSGPPLLASAAATAVRQWRYSPPLLNGTPIELQKRITVVFKLP